MAARLQHHLDVCRPRLRRALRPHVLVAPAECLAVHMELPYLGTGAERVDWPAVAADVRAWAEGELGVEIP